MLLPRSFCVVVILLFFAIVLLPILLVLVSPLIWQAAGSHISILDERHLSLAKKSLVLATGATGLALFIGVPLAFLCYRTNLLGRGLWKILYIIPILIPPYIHAIVWHRFSGQVNHLLSFDMHCLVGAIIVLALAYFPFVTLMTVSGLKSIDGNTEEASLLCHGAFKTLRGITLPLSLPHILSGALFVFIFSIIDFGVPDILRVRVYPIEIFIQFSALYDEAAASLLSFPLIGITLIVVILQKWYMRGRSYVNLGAGRGEMIRYDLGRYHPVALLFCISVFALSIFFPLAVLLKEAGPVSNYMRALTTSFNQIGYSIILAALGGLMAIFLAFPISYMIERSGAKGTVVLELATLIPFAIPAAALGIGFIKVWNRPLIDLVYGSSVIIILASVAHFIPFSIRATSSGIKQISPQLEEAGMLSTGSWIKVVKRILVPLSIPSLLAGFFIVFILSLGELGTTLLIIPTGKETIPIKIYNLMHYGADQMVAALCVILITITLGLAGIFLLFYKRAQRDLYA